MLDEIEMRITENQTQLREMYDALQTLMSVLDLPMPPPNQNVRSAPTVEVHNTRLERISGRMHTTGEMIDECRSLVRSVHSGLVSDTVGTVVGAYHKGLDPSNYQDVRADAVNKGAWGPSTQNG